MFHPLILVWLECVYRIGWTGKRRVLIEGLGCTRGAFGGLGVHGELPVWGEEGGVVVVRRGVVGDVVVVG